MRVQIAARPLGGGANAVNSAGSHYLHWTNLHLANLALLYYFECNENI